MKLGSIIALIAVSLSQTCMVPAADWPQWRGPNGQGHAPAKGLPLHWSGSSNVTWKTEIPGRGWSSPVIQGGQIWLTTALETLAKPEDAQRRLKTNTGDQPLTLLEKVELRAICVDRDSGKLLRDVLLLTVREPQWVHQLNSYASPTPVIEQGRLYGHFGALGTACADTRTGKVVWTNRELAVMHENGPGSSPVLWKNLLIFHMDGSDAQFAAALDKRTGKLVWKTTRSGEMHPNGQQRKSYGTPLVLEVNGKEQLISPATDWVYGYAPATGKELWKVPYGQLGFSLTPRPVAGHGMLYVATGFGRGQILAIRYASMAQPEIVWRFNKGSPTIPSPLLVGDELYFVNDGGIFTCLDAHTGREIYRERLGGNHNTAPLFADGRIFVFSREGVTSVIKPGKQFEVLAKNELPGKIMASPAAVDHALFIRTDTALYRIENGARSSIGAR